MADLLEEIPLSAPMPTVDCPRCGKALRLAGSRWDQAMRLFLLHALPPLVVAQLFSGVAGFVLALALLPFSFRAVALERAR
ncbi:MAG TPA: hypothetical protein PKC84_15705 [Paracoccaceae bacterium]|nr:hypothetical protein [Paracoccaceae bacterium]